MFQEQSEAFDGMHQPADTTFLSMASSQSLSFERGMISNEFYVKLDSGRYKPVMQNKLGTFYLAPLYGFEYGREGDMPSEIGGIYVPQNEAEAAHEWFVPSYYDPIGAWAEMSIPRKAVLSASAAVGSRPWLEKEFLLDRSQLSFVIQ